MDEYLFSPDEKKRTKVSCFIIVLVFSILKTYIDLTENTGIRILYILNIILTVLLLIIFALLQIKKLDDYTNLYCFLIIFVYILFIPLLGFAIYFRTILPDNLKNKYLVITVFQLLMAHGIIYATLE